MLSYAVLYDALSDSAKSIFVAVHLRRLIVLSQSVVLEDVILVGIDTMALVEARY